MLKRSSLQICGLGLLLICSIVSVSRADSGARNGSASIQATAQVVPVAGLAKMESIIPSELEVGAIEVTGSHLFWLYYPRPGGIQVQISDSAGLDVSAGDLAADGSESRRLRFLTRYDYASLVALEESQVGGDPITITITFTDN